MNIILAFTAGGVISAAVQILIDRTPLTPPRILVCLVNVGALLYSIGLYDPLKEIFGAGVSVPLIGFGAAIARGVREAVISEGPIGILTGGLAAVAPGLTLALVLGVTLSVFYRARSRRMGKK